MALHPLGTQPDLILQPLVRATAVLFPHRVGAVFMQLAGAVTLRHTAPIPTPHPWPHAEHDFLGVSQVSPLPPLDRRADQHARVSSGPGGMHGWPGREAQCLRV